MTMLSSPSEGWDNGYCLYENCENTPLEKTKRKFCLPAIPDLRHAALVRLPGSAKGALRHRDLWGLSIRKDDSSQQNYQGAGRSMGHPTIHGLILQVSFGLVVL